MIECQHVVQNRFSMLLPGCMSGECTRKNLIICAPKIEALAENFEAVELVVG